MGVLDGKVALVTGAGGGIGRCHALALAAEGARVVVNDLGGARDGTGSSSTMADQVVQEICDAGGEAVTNHASVTDPEGCSSMVAAALDTWGRLDIVVNNAGILRDRTFKKMSDLEWHAVLDVHLNGTRNVIQAALPALREQGGAIINTTSVSGMLGNFGQSNYGAAKAGIYALTRILSIEFQRAGITVNAIAPIALTRMTEDLGRIPENWRPEHISPIVVYLASDHAKGVTGRVFGVQGQQIHLYEVHTNDGATKEGDALWTVDEIAARFDEITSWPTPSAVEEDFGEAGRRVSTAFSQFPSGFKADAVPGWKAIFHWILDGAPSQTIQIADGTCTVTPGTSGTPTCTIHTDADTLLELLTGQLEPAQAFMSRRAKGDNMGDLMKMSMAFDFAKIQAAIFDALPALAPLADEEAPTTHAIPIGKRYDGGYWLVTNEAFQTYARATNDDTAAYFGDAPIAPPMFHVRPIYKLLMNMVGDPELSLNMLRLVHGEHDMRFHRPLRHGDMLHLRAELRDVTEKSSGTVATFAMFGFVDGSVALEGSTTFFIRAEKRSGTKSKKPKPDAGHIPDPDWHTEQPVSEDQALRYADASGDRNPIHIDPETAKRAGLPGCILHGLCTMAFAQRDLIQHYADGDPTRLRRLAVRWARPVFPGETLTLKVWKHGEGELEFLTENANGKPVITGGRAEIA